MHISFHRYSATLQPSTNAGLHAFEIVETNRFKNVTHISLKLAEADAGDLVSYLSTRLHQVKATGAGKQQELQDTHVQLAACQASLESAGACYPPLNPTHPTHTHHRTQQLESAASTSSATLKVQHAAEVSALREEAAMAAEAASQRYSQQLAQLSSSHSYALAQQREATEAAQQAAKAAETKAAQLQFDLQSCERELASWRGKAESSEAELTQHRSAAQAAGATTQQQAQGLTSAQMEIVGLKTQVCNLEELLGSVREHLEAERESHAVTRESLSHHKDALRRLQEKLSTSISEIEKGNRIITRLKEEHRVLRSKLKLQVSRAKQADLAAGSGKQRLGELSATLADSRRERQVLQEKLADKEAELAAARNRLSDAEGIINKNTAVIDHLNRSLSELESSRLGRGLTSPYTSSYAFRSPPSGTRQGGRYSWEAGSGASLAAARLQQGTPNPLPLSSTAPPAPGSSDVAARVQARVASMAASMKRTGTASEGTPAAAGPAAGGRLTQAERRQAEAMAGLDLLLGGDGNATKGGVKEVDSRGDSAPKVAQHAYFSEDFFGPGEGDSGGGGGGGSVFASRASEPSVQ